MSSTWMRHVDYRSADGRQRCRTLARNNRLFCSGRSAQEQKPSTKPWMQWQKEQDNILGTFWEIALFLPYRAVRFRGLLCYGNWLVNICKPMEMSTVSSSHVKGDAAVLSRPSGSGDLIAWIIRE